MIDNSISDIIGAINSLIALTLVLSAFSAVSASFDELTEEDYKNAAKCV